MKGWIKLYREITENNLWLEKPFSRSQALIDLLLLACHKDNYIIIRGIQIPLKRGQIGWSIVKLADRWGWSRTKVKLFLNLLKKEQQINQQTNNISLIITIINYEKYQSQNGEEKATKNVADWTAEVQQKDTNKNDKNEKNNNILPNIKKKEIPLIDQRLTREQIYNISIKKNVWCPNVIKKYYSIRDLIEGGEFKPRWGKNLNLILHKWIEMAINRGEMQEMDEMHQVLNKSYAPNQSMGNDMFNQAQKARQEGKI